ncbi:threo-3-hydroxy-L-aspartate ammonia-lyase [Methylocapsa sp. S129]|uniref:threo-3-hydroxy-L-aspartate ammonia-lyase n=1 Tax=Methylocapsa sp. S129 TaxID=1641869 RepID=UPI00131D4FFB|nr:threo-3-hydroxy-L-aspartate ammonia-lyase [Methylocapsa sp. S129]
MSLPPSGREESLVRPHYDDVVRAAERLEGVAHRAPVHTSRTANERTRAELFFKCENFQRGGAFKFRGAYNAVAALSSEQRRRGIVTYSSGNHAQALAYAGKLQGVEATIIMPNDAPEMKVAATRGYGGHVQFYDRYSEDREEIGRRLAADRGLALIPPYDHPDVIAGQGTSARELIESVGQLDILIAPLGGGGLLAGSAIAAKHLSPSVKVIGVEPEAGNDGVQSFRKGEVVHIPPPKSIADGAIVTHLGYHNFPIIQDLVDDIVTVSDAQLIEAMRFFAERMKMVVEPTGCLGAAAALGNIYPVEGKRVGVILSGGNVDIARFCALLAA